MPEEENETKKKLSAKHAASFAEFGDSIGAYFAVETGPEKAAVLRDFLDSLGATGVRA